MNKAMYLIKISSNEQTTDYWTGEIHRTKEHEWLETSKDVSMAKRYKTRAAAQKAADRLMEDYFVEGKVVEY